MVSVAGSGEPGSEREEGAGGVMKAVCGIGHLWSIEPYRHISLDDRFCICGAPLYEAELMECLECPRSIDGKSAVYVLRKDAKICPRGHLLIRRLDGGGT